MKILEVVLILLAFDQINGHGQFQVNVVDYTGENIESTQKFRCYGTIISSQHVLTTANCAAAPASGNIGILAHHSMGTLNFTYAYAVEKVSLHPNYETGHNKRNNLAVIKLSGDNEFNTTHFTKLSYGSIPNNTLNCSLWSDPETEINIIISPPNLCGDSAHPTPNAFCSFFEAINDPACAANLGSAVICGDSHVINGLVVGTTTACDPKDTKFIKSYHSVGDYKDWIEKAVNSAVIAKFSTLFFAFMALMTIKIFY